MIEIWSPSVEELELLATSDEEIRKKNNVFSFDLNDFNKRIEGGDRWQLLIQAHLFFEHVVAQILLEALAKPEAISLSRMGFSQRLDLVVAMNLLPDDVVLPIRKISSLRNKIAHDLKFEVSDLAVRDLEISTPIHLRDLMRDSVKGVNGTMQLHHLLKVILLQVEIIRQSRAAKREIEKKSELHLRVVLQEIPNVKIVR